MFTRLSVRLSAKFLLLAVLLIIPAACSLTGDEDGGVDRPTLVPTSFVIATQTPLVVTATPAATTAVIPTTAPLATTAPVVVQPCGIPSGWIAYRVVAGDTVGNLAQRTGTTAAQLASGNCLVNANVISVGQTLYVPRAPVAVVTNTPVVTTCTLAPRLTIGGQGRVSPGTPNAVRSLPNKGSTSVVIGEIPGGGVFSVLAGPQCADGFYWWQVNYGGLIGWTAEGQGSTYWLEPVTTCTLAPRLTIGGQGRVLPGTPNALRSLPNKGSTSVVIGEIPGGGVFYRAGRAAVRRWVLLVAGELQRRDWLDTRGAGQHVLARTADHLHAAQLVCKRAGWRAYCPAIRIRCAASPEPAAAARLSARCPPEAYSA